MSRVTIDNFRRYDHHLKRWHRGDGLALKQTLQNFHQTEEAGAVAFYPVGGTPLEGKVKFSFTETPPASGDKGPENPSTITGISNLTCGLFDNLYDINTYSNSLDSSITIDNDGFINFTKTNTSNNWISVNFNLPYKKLDVDNNTYYLVLVLKEFYEIDLDTNTYVQPSATWRSRVDLARTDPVDGVANYGYKCYGNTFGIGNGSTNVNYKRTPGFYYNKLIEFDNNGSNQIYFFNTSFRVYKNSTMHCKFKLAVCKEEYLNLFNMQFGSTYYGGSIDLATGLMTVTWIGKILDRNSLDAANAGFTWTTSDKLAKRLFFRLNGSAAGFPAIKDINHVTCSHFRQVPTGTEESLRVFGVFGINTAADRWFMFYDHDMTISDESKTVYENRELFLDWFEAKKQAGDPVYLVYELKEPQTVQLSPLSLSALAQTSRHEPRLNTVYTDADSIQITYQKSPIRAATEHEQAILSLGGNV